MDNKMSECEIANEYLDFACVSNFFHIYDTENNPPLTLIFLYFTSTESTSAHKSSSSLLLNSLSQPIFLFKLLISSYESLLFHKYNLSNIHLHGH